MGRRSGAERGLGRLAVVLVVLVVVAAAVVAAVGMGLLGAPSVAGVSNHFGTVSESETTIETAVVVNNPNPIGLGLDDVAVAYAADLNDVRIATGRKEGVAVGTGNTSVELTTRMQNSAIPEWWVAHLQDGEHSELVVHATVTSGTLDESVDAPAIRKDVDTDIASSFNTTETRPIEADQEPLVTDPVLYVNETRGWWGTVTDAETPVELRMVVYNPKPYPIDVQEVRYDVRMNDIAVGSGGTDRSYVIPPEETRTVAAELVIRNEALDDWWVSHLERNQRTALEMELSLVVDLSDAPGGGPTVTVPVDTLEHTIDTDVFGNKAEYPTGGSAGENGTDDGRTPTEAGSGTSTDAPGSTSTETAGSTPTETSQDASTPTETPTPTPTDDGGILDTETDDPLDA